MRVIAGRAGSLRLKAVPGRGTRPTTDRVKESVFGVLAERCIGARVLDLFAGTGSLGIEALSRGAEQAVFVEQDPGAARVLRENLRTTGLAGEATVLVREALAALNGALRGEGRPFDLVFLDPPYGKGVTRTVIERLGQTDAPLAPGALLVAEHSGHEMLPDEVGELTLIRRKRYGETMVSFYHRAGGETDGAEGGEPRG